MAATHSAAKDAHTTQTPQPAELLITMKVFKDSRSDLTIKHIEDRFDDIIARFDATQRSQASIHQILSSLMREVQQSYQQQRRYHQCNKGCGQEIYFDANNKSQSGKWIPLDKDTGLPHQCQ